jgi:hypothetical protein
MPEASGPQADPGYEGVRRDWSWSDRFLPRVRELVGAFLLVPSGLGDDRLRATDLRSLRMEPVTVGCRVIRPQPSVPDAHGHFTVRCDRPGGQPGELTKILNGYCDYFFYGYSVDREGSGLGLWNLIDLEVFRRWCGEGRLSGLEPIRTRDGSASFYALKWSWFPPELVVASGRG